MAAEEDVTMADVDGSTEWLVERARQSLKENNPYEAKAWLITAKTLYPKDFGVQVSLQIMCSCRCKNILSLCTMVSKSLKFLLNIYMLFTGREVRMGKNCARGLEYGPRP